jgi:hypothetical protein
MTDQGWLDALEQWAVDPETWDTEKLGSPLDQPNNRIPPDVAARFNDRLRKREERRRDREAAAARQAEADQRLRDRLIAATHGGFTAGPKLDDLSAIKAALALGIALDNICRSVRSMTDKRIFPGNEPVVTWSEKRIILKIAQDYAKHTLVPSMVAAMEAAGTAPGKPANASEPSPATPRARDTGGHAGGGPATV